MTIALPPINPRDVTMLHVLDALLARRLHSGNDRDRIDVKVDILGVRLHLRVCGNAMSEALLELAGDGASALQALRWHLGPDIEMATMHRRVHRWLIAGREVILDSFNGEHTCLRVS
jgi:hypothetical protein